MDATLAVIILFVPIIWGFPNVKIGGIFEKDYIKQAFHLGIKLANDRAEENSVELIGQTEPILEHDALNVTDTVCALFERGILGIFGPSTDISSYLDPICDRLEIPHVEIHWDSSQTSNKFLVNLHPHPSMLWKVYVDTVRALNWQQFTVLYEDGQSLARVQQLLSMYSHREHTVTLRQLENINGSYRNALARLKKSGESYYVIDCSLDTLEKVLRQALQVGLMTEGYHYVITNLDLQTIDLVPYQYGGANITGFRLMNPEDPAVKEVEQELKSATENHWNLRVDSALIIDAVHLFYEALMEQNQWNYLHVKSLMCGSSNSWKHGGFTFITHMKTKTINGLTGTIMFDLQGFRSDFAVDVVELGLDGLVKIGRWNASTGYTMKRDYTVKQFEEEPTDGSLSHKSFVVITCLTPPYGMLKETTTQLSGNERYEGFCIDLINELSRLLGFNYTFIIQEDGANGNLDEKTGQWNGMIKEIMEGRADLAITDLTITSDREKAVDFTMPFMNLGISILYSKPVPVPPSLFMFSSPFSIAVWLSLGVAYFVVSFCFFVMGRLSPSEWTNPYPCIDEPEFLVNQFSIRNSLWFTIGSLMQQGSEIAPIGLSTRMAAGVWWFFTLIMVSSYTANLAAFLTVETLVTPFKNMDELAKQKEIEYGAKKGGTTEKFFRDSNNSEYNKVWKLMQDHPKVMTMSNEEGVKRVETENYAFLMESTSIEYITERHCTLAQVGNLLDDKGYGIAMKKDSPYRNALSQAIVKLQETGKITALKIKWWKENRGGGNCISRSDGGQPTPLSLQNVGGVFLVLSVGTVVGLLSTFIQLGITVFQLAYKENISFKDEFVKELRFLFNFKQMVKPVKSSSTT